MDVMKPWIAKRITELLGFEDDIVVDYCVALLQDPPEKGLDARMVQVNLTGFMERKAAPFCSELWQHLLSAQESPVGVPREFIDLKKDELRQKKEEAERVQGELSRRRQDLEEASRSARTARDGADRDGGRDGGRDAGRDGGRDRADRDGGRDGGRDAGGRSRSRGRDGGGSRGGDVRDLHRDSGDVRDRDRSRRDDDREERGGGGRGRGGNSASPSPQPRSRRDRR
ncbi:unnamed protein product [Polarella glacialis]|uniref:PWI domain-containing protein n=1 Tax=Polarella glacialis TaxID=89957 RepID=A0A813IVD4_POLGL|nr:unnamed protein product [Polarella glacialis]